MLDSLQRECNHFRSLSDELAAQNRNLHARVADLDAQLDARKRELQRHEDLATKYGESVQELEYQFEAKEIDMAHLREANAQLKEAVERERIISKDAQTLKVTLEEEMGRRKQKERECEQIRMEMQQAMLMRN